MSMLMEEPFATGGGFGAPFSAFSSAEPPPILRACDMCRKKKIRCKPTAEGCVSCTKFKTTCHFTPIARKKKPRRPAGLKYISHLEERLKKMEGLLQTAINNQDVEDLPSSSFEQDAAWEFGQLESGTENVSTVAINRQLGKATRAEGTPVSNLSTLSQSLNSYEGLAPSRLFNQSSAPPRHLFPPLMESSLYSPPSHPLLLDLPPKHVALNLVQDEFESFNCFFPLFDQEDFLSTFHDQYMRSTPSDPAWWACINVVLSLAHRFRAMRNSNVAYENAQSCGHLHNALAVVSELNLLRNSLPAVQALLGMVIILQGTPNPHACSVLIGAAVRLAQAMGLHIETPVTTVFTAAQAEQRRRVFWIAYLLDKDISFRTGCPSAQDDDEMDISLPSENVPEQPPCGNGLGTINLFHSRIGLAIIQGQIYKKLYSVQAAQRSAAEKAAVAQELNTVLDYWKSSVPLDVEDEILDATQLPLGIHFLHRLILNCAYIHCLVVIYQHLPEASGGLIAGPSPNAPVAFPPKESICVTESRKALRLVQITPHGNFACVWLLLHPFFGAVTALLRNVVRNPASETARRDIQLVEPFLLLLDVVDRETRADNTKGSHQSCVELNREGRPDEVKSILQFCTKLNREAKDAVDGASRAIFLS